MPRLAMTVLLLVMLGGSVTGCAGSGGGHPATGAAPTAQVTPATNSNRTARSPLVVAVGRKHPRLGSLPARGPARVLSPARLAVATIGSTGCPTIPQRLIVQSPDAIEIRLEVKTPPNGLCFDNAFLTRYVIAIDPSQIDVHHRLTIRLYYPRGVIRRYERPVVVEARPL